MSEKESKVIEKEETSISILGSEWQILLESPSTSKMYETVDGWCDESSRSIHIVVPEDDSEIVLSMGNINNFINKVCRHEIVHAFLVESGLDFSSSYATSWATNEEMVDWIAIQGPKIHKVWKDLGII